MLGALFAGGGVSLRLVWLHGGEQGGGMMMMKWDEREGSSMATGRLWCAPELYAAVVSLLPGRAAGVEKAHVHGVVSSGE